MHTDIFSNPIDLKWNEWSQCGLTPLLFGYMVMMVLTNNDLIGSGY